MKRSRLLFSVITIIATIAMSCSPKSSFISAESDDSEPFLSITSLTIELTGSDDAVERLMVSSSDAWFATVTSDSTDWLTIIPDEGEEGVTTIDILISANPYTTPRIGTITISNLTLTKDIEITQPASLQGEDPNQEEKEETTEENENEENEEEENEESTPSEEITYSLSISSTSHSATTSSGAITIDITSNTSWSISESLDWVSISPESGFGDGVVNVNYTENTATSPRSGILTFSGDEVKSIEYTISQQSAATIITINKLTESVTSLSGSTTLDVTSNSSWSVESNASWAKPLKSSGNENEVLTITYDANTTILQRTALITLTTPIGESVLFTLTQEAGEAYFTVEPTTNITLPKDGGSSAIAITTNVEWSISASESWVVFDQTSGSADTSVTISAGVNDSQQQRTATITLTAGSGEFTTTITLDQETTHLPDFNIDEL